jgi:phage-related protein
MRILEPYKNYFWEFYSSLEPREREKVDYVFQVIISVSRVPIKFLKHVDDGICEIRVEVNSNIYRIFSFFDDENLVILLHGFQKKSQKLPDKEISKAKKLRNEYYENKLSKNH